jgi:signal transduction histidine kinase
MTARLLQRLPIRHKLVAMLMLTSTIVLLLASIGYLANDYYRTRDDLISDFRTQVDLVIENVVAAVQYHDQSSARATLATLAADPHLRVVCLYGESGSLFARYEAPHAANRCPPTAPPDGEHYTWNRYDLTKGILLENKRVGSAYLRSDIAAVWTRLRTQGFIVLALLGLTLGVALIVSARLQGLVSGPVMALAATAAQVSSRGDYSLRAKRTTDDELGMLVDAFNRVLERIQSREQELSEANEELRREVAERKRAEQERAELLVREREANRLKDEFLATLSHELRTPLNAILGWTKLLRAHAIPQPGMDRALEKVERNAQIQARLVEDLLEVSRIASGKLHLEMRPIDLVAIVRTAVDSIRPAAEARGVAIHREFVSSSVPTIGDADRLQQVIWNLLSNAVKFTPSGGSVTIHVERQALFDEIRVRDTGIGIEPSFLPSVFDTFRQADASSTRAHGGLGLGLSIVKQLVDMHGGAVEADSQGPDAGATFTVRLPVRNPEAHTAPEAELAPELPSPAGELLGTTVLVVDDDRDTRELLVSVFDAAGAKVHAAASAGEGLTAAVEHLPDVLVSDIAMPGRNGYDLMEQLTEALGPRAPRVSIAVTAFASDGEREKSTAAGFDRHVTKPFDPVELVKMVQTLLDAGSP